MSKPELIEAIRRHNRTVPKEFLERFAEKDLQAYLDRVCDVMPETPPPKHHVMEHELITA